MKKNMATKKTSEEAKPDELEEQKFVPEAHKSSETKIEELTDLLKRTHAEFENYKKRVDNERQNYLKYSSSVILAKLLPLLDTIDSAIKNNPNKEVVKAVELIRNEVRAFLKNEGVMPIKAHDESFDPFKHEAVMIEDTVNPKNDNIVVEELQRGYILHDKVLRHSKVKVAKYKEEIKNLE